MEIKELINIITAYIKQTYPNTSSKTRCIIKDENSKNNSVRALTIFAPNGHIIFISLRLNRQQTQLCEYCLH